MSKEEEQPEWVQIVRKVTTEEEKGDSASGKAVNKTTTTTREWSINRKILPAGHEPKAVANILEGVYDN